MVSYTLQIKKQAKKALQSVPQPDRTRITEQLKHSQENEDYEVFDPADYIDNPVALARIQAGITQEELAKLMCVTQAYVSKVESKDEVTPKLLNKVHAALKQ